jgi:Spy/CpxP family protein refolding chaperone
MRETRPVHCLPQAAEGQPEKGDKAMTDDNRTDPHDRGDFNQTIESEPRKTGGWSRKAMFGGAIAGLLVGAGILAVTGSGFARSGGPGGFMHGYAEYRIEKALDDMDASKDQTDRIMKIFDDTRTDLMPMFGGFRDTRESLSALIGASSIDREAIEKLRVERMMAMDAASKRVVTAIADAAEVLTPEQRKELVEKLHERRHGRW